MILKCTTTIVIILNNFNLIFIPASGRPAQSAASKQTSEDKATARLKVQKNRDQKRSSTKGSSHRGGQTAKLQTTLGHKPTSAATSKISVSKSTSSTIKKVRG